MVLPPVVRGVIVTQTFCVFVISMICLKSGVAAILSALLGGVVCLLPAWGFARCFFGGYANKRSARGVLNRLYWAEAIKLILTILGICFCMQWPDLLPIPFFVSFVVCQFVYWINGLVSSVQEKIDYVR